MSGKHHHNRRAFLGNMAYGCASLGVTTLLSSWTIMGLINAAASANRPIYANSEYKALVCILLAGENDSYNMLIPRGNGEYTEYAFVRSNLSIPQNSLLPINPLNPDGKDYGLHPELGKIVLGQGDIDDFSECIDQFGLKQNADCICGDQKLTGGGKFIGHNGVGVFPSMAAGLPDKAHSGYVGFLDRLFLSYPTLPIGTEICFTLGFDDIGGIAGIELNDIGTYTFENTLDSVNFFMQEYCITTIERGPQTIAIRDLGDGGVRVDGSVYEYCPCTSTDQDELSPDCQCPGNQVLDTGTFISEFGFTDGIAAAGEADGTFTGSLGYQDTLTLEYPNISPNTKICITAGFSDQSGVVEIIQTNFPSYMKHSSNEFIFTIQKSESNQNFRKQKRCSYNGNVGSLQEKR